MSVSFAAFECPLVPGIAWTLGTGLRHNRLQSCIIEMEKKAKTNLLAHLRASKFSNVIIPMVDTLTGGAMAIVIVVGGAMVAAALFFYLVNVAGLFSDGGGGGWGGGSG